MLSRAPGAGQTSKTHPQKSGQTASKYLIKMGASSPGQRGGLAGPTSGHRPLEVVPNHSLAALKAKIKFKNILASPESGPKPTQNPDLFRKMTVRTLPRDHPGDRRPKNKMGASSSGQGGGLAGAISGHRPLKVVPNHIVSDDRRRTFDDCTT